MDLRASSSRSSSSAGAIAIPAARRPFHARKQRQAGSGFFLLRRLGRRIDADVQLRHVLAMAEGALVVIGAYVLLGAGIGLAAGSVVVGAAAGAFAGFCAVSAIFLIRGSAVAAGTATEPVCEEKVPVGSAR